jgi:hypothetical protein
MNGRGTEFDENVVVCYQGTFRNNVRDGRGQETLEGKLSFSGEYKVFEKVRSMIFMLLNTKYDLHTFIGGGKKWVWGCTSCRGPHVCRKVF